MSILSLYERRIDVSKQSLKTKPFEIDWSSVDAAPLADTPDEDSPELTDAEFAELRPLDAVLPELDVNKQRVTLILDEAVVRAYKTKAGKRGYQALINDTLRRALESNNV